MGQNRELKIKELGQEPPPPPTLGGVYKPVLVVDKFLYVSGQGPVQSDGTLMSGKLGDDLGLEEGKKAERQEGQEKM